MTDLHVDEQQPTIVQTGAELVQPLVDHAEKITRLENEVAKYDVELARRIGSLRDEITQEMNSRMTGHNERIDALAKRLDDLLALAEEVPEEVVEAPEEVAETVVPEVVEPKPEQKPENAPKGMLARRKAKHVRR